MYIYMHIYTYIYTHTYIYIQSKKAVWSPITSFMSMGGNLIRIFTTIQLTKDPLVMSGIYVCMIYSYIYVYMYTYVEYKIQKHSYIDKDVCVCIYNHTIN
jgi:hypothetical protein